MSLCAVVDANGFLVAATQPCTGLVVLTPSEFALITANPFVLSVEDGALVGGAIGAVWLLAWSFRAIRSVLSDSGASVEGDS
jgi:hypothetical protein